MSIPVKIVIAGDCKVGKTTLLQSYDQFILYELPTYKPTSGVNHKLIKSRLNQKKYDLHFWDISGDAQYNCIITNYLHKLDILIIVFSMHDRKSFNNVVRWYNMIKSKSVTEFELHIIGTTHPNKFPDIREKELKTLSTQLNVKIKTIHHHSLQSFRYFLTKQIIKINQKNPCIEITTIPLLENFQIKQKKQKWWQRLTSLFVCCS
jgi:small GTP-binding protein